MGEKLGLQNLSSKVEVFPYLTQGITVKEFLLLKFCNRLTSFIFRLYGSCPKYILSLRFDDMRLSILYGFYLKEVSEEYSHVVKIFNSALIFIYSYAMNDTKVLYKTSERSSTPCLNMRLIITSEVCSRVVTNVVS